MAELDGETPAEIEIAVDGDLDAAPVVRLEGELDASNVERLDAVMATLMQTQPPRVVFDLGGLRFVDSAGLSVLVRVAAEAELVAVRDPSPIVRRLIEVTGLTSVLRIEP